MAETQNLIARLSLDDQFTAKLRKAQGTLGQFDSSIKRTGRGMGQLGAGIARVASVGFTAAAAGIGVAAKEAIAFEDAFAGVRKTVNEADLKAAGLSFDALSQQFKDLSRTIPIAAGDFARIGETAGALGIKAQDITGFTKTVALLGVTTNLTTDAAADALGRIGSILNFTGKDFENFSDTLVALGNNGASTESDIIELTKRFAAAGRQAGLTTPQILALSSAASSMGIEAEAGGGALSRIFANIAADGALATKEGKAWASITGMSIKQLQGAVKKGQTFDVYMTFLEKIGKMDRLEAAKALQRAGITNVRDRDAILKMSQNLDLVREQLGVAQNAAGALGEEAQKRFDTVASKLILLRNNLQLAAITVGEGLAPAIGRAAEKLSAFLAQDSNQNKLRKLGQDIGKFIDGIDWNQVMQGASGFLVIMQQIGAAAMTIAGALNRLPTEVKAMGIGLIATNKLSGGMIGAGIGNILGGLGETLARSLASKVPLFGKAFVQPVFVTNMGMGGMGGGLGGAVGGAGRAGFLRGGLAAVAGRVGAAALTGAGVGMAALAAAAVYAVQQHVENEQTATASRISDIATRDVRKKSASELTTAIRGTDEGIARIKSLPGGELVFGDTLRELQQTRTTLQSGLERVGSRVEYAVTNRKIDPQINVTVPVNVTTTVTVRDIDRTVTRKRMLAPRSVLNAAF